MPIKYKTYGFPNFVNFYIEDLKIYKGTLDNQSNASIISNINKNKKLQQPLDNIIAEAPDLSNL